jgi:hypothetical protein
MEVHVCVDKHMHAVLQVQVGMRKFSGEIYDATPTIVAMGRQPEWDSMLGKRFYERFLIWPLYFGALGRSNFYGVDQNTTTYCDSSMSFFCSFLPDSMIACLSVCKMDQ